MLKMLMRRGSVRLACLGLLAITALAYVYYYSSSAPTPSSALNPLLHKHVPVKTEERRSLPGGEGGGEGGGGGGVVVGAAPEGKGDGVNGELVLGNEGQGQGVPSHQCHSIQAPRTDINTFEQFPKFDFQPSWMRGKEFWDTNFEKRYLKRRSKWKKLPLKVVLMPHSHNDPGWLKTFEEYYFHQTSKILQNMIDKLRIHSNMTFIWTEVSFLSLWYERAHPSLRQQLKELVDGGRLEVATGGWIMTDEANVHLYAMLDQLVEGHHWLFNTLGVRAANGWSVDPFGHGAAVPYLLGASDVNNIVIQRIHYAWKQWLAEQQLGDFLWRQVWDSTGATDVLCHNRPYDIYSIKHSCGPHPQICLGFDFRKVPGEYTEYTIKSVPIDEKNVRQKAELLLEQYGRTGSLYPHNVVLVPIGDDFRYDHAEEWDQQYINYQRIINFINSDPKYHASIQWGTLKDYFGEVRKRMRDYTTLQGDFFVYSDIFSEGRPAYWSGYFATRPYWKILDRQLEASLRSAEILYTWAYTKAVQDAHSKVIQILEKDYEKLVRARRNLGLFQHHDAITGTSKAYVMHDYAIKLHEGLRDSVALQAHAMEFLLLTAGAIGSISAPGALVTEPLSRLQPDYERATYERLPRKLPLDAPRSQPRLIVLFNSLAQRRHEVVKVLVRTPDVRLTDEHDHEVPFQLNPVWSDKGNGLAIVSSQFVMFFVADLPPLSVVTYALHRSTTPTTEQRATVYSNYFAQSSDPNHSPPFETNEVLPGDIQLESDHLKLLFDGTTGMLRSITNKDTDRVTQTTVRYAAYPSAQFKSGAYLFKPDPNAREPEEDVLSGTKPHIFIHSGPIASELTVMFGSVLMHTTRIFHVDAEPLATAVYLENTYNLGTRYNSTETPGFPPHFRETELFLRIMTDIDNGAEPEFFTDQSGLHMQRRIRVKRIGIQGNYFPITSATFLQDNTPASRGQRLTLLVDHATGAASWRQGWLEVMVERRTFYDDARGMGEGVTDQKKTVGRYWLLLEDIVHEDEEVPRLSLAAHHLSNTLNYPATLLVNEGLTAEHLNTAAHLISRPLPCPLHVLTLRTLPEHQYPSLLPSRRALLVVQHQAASCTVNSRVRTCTGLGGSPYPGTQLTISPSTMELTSLTGLRVQGPLPSLADLDVPQHRLQGVLLTFPMHQHHHHRRNPNNESNKQPQGKL